MICPVLTSTHVVFPASRVQKIVKPYTRNIGEILTKLYCNMACSKAIWSRCLLSNSKLASMSLSQNLCRGGDSSFLQLIIRGTRMLQWLQERETNHAILASESKGGNSRPMPQLLQKPTRAEKGMVAIPLVMLTKHVLLSQETKH